MAFWSTQRFTAEQNVQGMIEGFVRARLRCGKYELRLSREVLTTPVAGRKIEPQNDDRVLSIQPGQFAFLYTEESVSVPATALAFISMRTAKKWEGLVNISGFHVDPGFSGRLKFSVFNAGSQPVHLEYGEETFLIWFADFDQAVEDPYDGGNNHQNHITPSDYKLLDDETHSAASLHRRVEKLEFWLKIAKGLIVILLIPLLIGISVAVFSYTMDHSTRVSSCVHSLERIALSIFSPNAPAANAAPSAARSPNSVSSLPQTAEKSSPQNPTKISIPSSPNK